MLEEGRKRATRNKEREGEGWREREEGREGGREREGERKGERESKGEEAGDQKGGRKSNGGRKIVRYIVHAYARLKYKCLVMIATNKKNDIHSRK